MAAKSSGRRGKSPRQAATRRRVAAGRGRARRAAEVVSIEAGVPAAGLPQRDYMGVGYVHNEILPDRRTAWPVSRGVPLPRGAVREVEALALRDAAGADVPRQVRALAHWPDGSVMFAHLAWQADVAHDRPAPFALALDGGGAAAPAQRVEISQAEAVVRVVTGPLEAEIDATGGTPMLSLSHRGQRVAEGPIELWTTDAQGASYRGVVAGPAAVRVVEAGPLVGVVELRGRHEDDRGGVFLDFILRLRFDAGRPELRLTHTFLNLGDEPEGVKVGQIGLRLPELRAAENAAAAPATHVVRQTASGVDSFARFAEFPEDAEVTIGPAGPRIADTAVLREDITGYPPYVLRYLDQVDHWIGMRTAAWSAVSFIHEAQANWPKKFVARGGVLEYHLWPADLPEGQVQDLRQGMARTHHMQLSFFAADAKPQAFQEHVYQIHTPPLAAVPFAWYRRCAVLGMQHVMEWRPRQYPLLEGQLLGMMERGWASGMLNYGDDPDAGYGASYAALGVTTRTVWINNEHDFMAQAVTQFWRTNRSNAWRSARVCAEHQIDVDFVRKSADRWKAGGIPAHSAMHTTAAAYPSHLWTEGLLAYYLTSGDERALEVAQSVGRLLCQYIEERYQVLAVESRMEGWSLIALAGLIEVTGDARCRQAAQTIVGKVREAFEGNGGYDHTGLNYGTGTVLTGLANLHRATGDPQALRLLTDLLDWHLAHARNVVGQAWSSEQLAPYDLNLTLPAYAYAYRATGRRKYLQEGLSLLRFTGPPRPQPAVRGAGKCYRTFIPILELAHQAGALKALEARLA